MQVNEFEESQNESQSESVVSETERLRVLAMATSDLGEISGLTTTQIDRMIQSFKFDNEQKHRLLKELKCDPMVLGANDLPLVLLTE